MKFGPKYLKKMPIGKKTHRGDIFVTAMRFFEDQDPMLTKTHLNTERSLARLLPCAYHLIGSADHSVLYQSAQLALAF